MRAQGPGGGAELKVPRAPLRDVGPRMLFGPKAPSFFLSSNKQET